MNQNHPLARKDLETDLETYLGTDPGKNLDKCSGLDKNPGLDKYPADKYPAKDRGNQRVLLCVWVPGSQEQRGMTCRWITAAENRATENTLAVAQAVSASSPEATLRQIAASASIDTSRSDTSRSRVA